uniref:helix-turn-helix domain-containing protein n=1 Tax=Amycolatopsis sp. CA-096443 TaxID=3239919 RepID=UPI003F497370
MIWTLPEQPADVPPDPLIRRILGGELREPRAQRGLTLTDLAARLPVSPQTLASYELGSRHCNVVRLFEIRHSLGELPGDVLTIVSGRLPGATGGAGIRRPGAFAQPAAACGRPTADLTACLQGLQGIEGREPPPAAHAHDPAPRNGHR